MIVLRSVSARGGFERGIARPVLRNVSLEWGPGLLAVLGTRADGATVLQDVIAGVLRPSTGSVAILGKTPEEARASIAYVERDVRLPDALTVAEVCDLAAVVRSEPKRAAAERLAPLGLESLAKRRTSSLSPSEARAVSLAIAISSRAPVLVIEEPLCGLEPMAPARVVSALRARASSGASVLVTTASVRDATRLADQLMLLTLGALTPLSPAYAHAGHDGAHLRVVISPGSSASVPALLAALQGEAAVQSAETAAFASAPECEAGVGLVVSGHDLVAVAAALGRAVARSGVDVEVVESAVMPIDAIRAMLSSPRPTPRGASTALPTAVASEESASPPTDDPASPPTDEPASPSDEPAPGDSSSSGGTP